MQFGLILPYYLSWHYTRALRDILAHIADAYWFTWNLFSFKTLLQTFFTPFQRLGVAAPKRFDPQKMLEAFAATLVMRLVGMLARTFFIAIGLAALVCLTIIITGFFVVWMLLPFIIVALGIAGVLKLVS